MEEMQYLSSDGREEVSKKQTRKKGGKEKAHSPDPFAMEVE